MSPTIQPKRRLPSPARWLAAALPLLVIALGLLAARPDWHAATHVQAEDFSHHDQGHPTDTSADERGCAVELFASGLIDSVAFASTALQPQTAGTVDLDCSETRFSSVASWPEPPGRAPPPIG